MPTYVALRLLDRIERGTESFADAVGETLERHLFARLRLLMVSESGSRVIEYVNRNNNEPGNVGTEKEKEKKRGEKRHGGPCRQLEVLTLYLLRCSHLEEAPRANLRREHRAHLRS